MKQRILVVEDNPPSRELLCDWLETEGYAVIMAADLKEGFAALQGQPPNLVLLDVKIGTDDGLTLASWMRQQLALQFIPVIAVTAHAMVTEQARIYQAGCNAVVSKPVDFLSLRQQIQKWLAH